MRKNICSDTDAYKYTHWLQRPKNITKLYIYGEPRKGGFFNEICFFGISIDVQEQLLYPITLEMINEAEEEAFYTFGTKAFFNREAWEKVMKLGYHPIKIMSVPEGSIVPQGNVCFTMESTKHWFANMLSHYEDALMWTWYTSDVATRVYHIKKAIKPYFDATCDIPELILPYAVNDFGLRGAQGYEAAVRGGMAHLIHFEGSDNMPASRLLKDFYGYKGRAKSVWATEHSVATSYGPGRGEYEYVIAQLSQFTNETKSLVIDSYDPDNFMRNVVGSEEVKRLVKAHKGRIVWRPDSDLPIKNALRYSDILMAHFGISINNKGYKVINENTGLIQGDGMNENTIPELYRDYTKSGWSAGNILTGSGGGLLVEGLTRDRQRWAIKASYGEKDGVPFDIRKTPKSDMSKQSKGGKLKLHKSGISYMTIQSSKETPQMFNSYVDCMKPVYENGSFYPTSFEEIIKNASVCV
jgi:nicotinamide phosphoribosyltransferase